MTSFHFLWLYYLYLEYKEHLRLIRKDDCAEVTIEVLGKMLRYSGYNPTSSELQDLMQAVDFDGMLLSVQVIDLLLSIKSCHDDNAHIKYIACQLMYNQNFRKTIVIFYFWSEHRVFIKKDSSECPPSMFKTSFKKYVYPCKSQFY